MSNPILSDTFDNILIRQKDYIFSLIDDKKFDEAIACLFCLTELWETANYRYKLDEIKSILLKLLVDDVVKIFPKNLENTFDERA